MGLRGAKLIGFLVLQGWHEVGAHLGSLRVGSTGAWRAMADDFSWASTASGARSDGPPVSGRCQALAA
jgi:hypothetical protein